MIDALQLLACPTCKGPLTDGADLTCVAHGVVAVRRLGAIDFLFNQKELQSAAGGSFDLKEDEAKAIALQPDLERMSFRALQQRLADDDAGMEARSALQAAAVRRFNESYARAESEVALSAGDAILNKVNPHLQDRGLPPVGGAVALEAGGGHGLHLPSFGRLFDSVVFLDCSLVNLVMGTKLTAETGVGDKVIYVRGDATALPFRDQVFDFVHEAGVIEHVDRPDRMVAEALRVISERGTYVCLSPNRYPLSAEPHFRLPLFGIFPKALRRRLIPLTRGLNAEYGTDLLSLWKLRRMFRAAGERKVPIYFLPRRLPQTARKTLLRRVIHGAFQWPVIGSMTSFVLNKLLLPVMPYHIAVVARQGKRR
ncbi:MAG TPA: class I SAM-dependent methyltransferase [Thermoanaerobaculia bacterium]|jgi:ubiquinone/menaquinone biosynthesis C-methylase UbiE